MPRWCALLASFLWLTPVLAVAAGGLGMTPPMAVTTALLVAAVICLPLSRVIVRALRTDSRLPLALRAAMAAAAVVAVLQIGSVSIFMADVTRTGFSVQPQDPFRRTHSCTSAYAEASRLLGEEEHNIYDRRLYRTSEAARRQLGPLNVDPYHYPPPFLLVPQAIQAAAPDFWSFRRVWFAFQAVVLAGALLGAAVWVGGRPGVWILCGGLILLALPHAAAALQQGNFQITAVPLAVAGFVFLTTGRTASGATVLAYTALAKIFPGILLVFLAGARRWREVAWLAGIGTVLLALTLAVQGVQPMRDFVSTSLPELSSGAAFPQTEMGQHSRVNWSVYGMTVRLRQLGVSWLTQSRGLMVAQIYGLLVVALAWWAGRKGRIDMTTPHARLDVLIAGLALVGLASFRSPFVGALYGVMSTLSIMTMFAARTHSAGRAALWLAALGALAGAIWLMPSPALPRSEPWIWLSGVLFLACVAIKGLGIAIAFRHPRRARPEELVQRAHPAPMAAP